MLLRGLLIIIFFGTACTAVKPVKLRSLDPELRENSGIALIGKDICLINDSGNTPDLHFIDPLRSVRVVGAENVDWEDMTKSGNRIFVADVGDNNKVREAKSVYCINTLSVADGDSIDTLYMIRILTDSLEYPKFDCEAVFYFRGSLVMIEKKLSSSARASSAFYSVADQAGTMNLTLMNSFPFNEPVTAADYDSINDRLLVTGYLSLFVFDNFSLQHSLKADRYHYNRIRPYEACIWRGDSIFISCERGFLTNPTLFFIQTDRLKKRSKPLGYIIRKTKLGAMLYVYRALVKDYRKS